MARLDGERDAAKVPHFDDRRCRDVFWCFLFVLFVGGMFAVTAYSVSNGDYRRVVNGMDYRGCICGTAMAVDSETQSCAEAAGAATLGSKSTFVQFLDTAKYGSDVVIWCTAACPSESVQLYCTDPSTGEQVVGTGSTLSEQKASIGQSSSWINDNCAVSTSSHNYLGYCVPNDAANSTFVKAASKYLDTEAVTLGFSSIERARWIIVASLAVSVVFAFIYMMLMKRMAGCVTWTALLLIFVGIIVGAIFLMTMASNYQTSIGADYKSNFNWQMTYYGSIATFVVAGIYLLIMLCMIKRINLAITCVELATEAIDDAKFITLTPLLNAVLILGIFGAWCVTTVYIFSAGTVKAAPAPSSLVPTGLYKEFELDTTLRYAFVYHLFGLFWTTQFVLAVGELVVAYVVVRWFFSRVENGQRQGPANPVLTAWGSVFKHHLGSAALGGLTIAIIQLLRAIVSWIDRRAGPKDKRSKTCKFVTTCCACCLWCLEKCMKYLNRQAYIQIALSGESFCNSAWAALWLIGRNLGSVGAIALVSTIFAWLGKLLIMVVSSLFCYAILTQVSTFSDQSLDTAVPNAFIPCGLVALLTFFIGSLFMAVYSQAIEAILMSYLTDKEACSEYTPPHVSKKIRELNDSGKSQGDANPEDDNGFAYT